MIRDLDRHNITGVSRKIPGSGWALQTGTLAWPQHVQHSVHSRQDGCEGLQMDRVLDYHHEMAESALPGRRRCTALQWLSRSSRAVHASGQPPGPQPMVQREVRVSAFLPVHMMQARHESNFLKPLVLTPPSVATLRWGLALPCSSRCAPA